MTTFTHCGVDVKEVDGVTKAESIQLLVCVVKLCYLLSLLWKVDL